MPRHNLSQIGSVLTQSTPFRFHGIRRRLSLLLVGVWTSTESSLNPQRWEISAERSKHKYKGDLNGRTCVSNNWSIAR